MDEAYYRRLATYENFPASSPMSKEELAWAGFVYTGESDRVKCEFCHIQFHEWQGTDVAFTEHARSSPTCPFVVPRSQSAVNNDMRFLYDRRVSYNIPQTPWPHTMATAPSPTVLADAGFYYTGLQDRVRCFHCGLVLHSWEPTGMPYHAHARFSPRCPYMIVEKGIDWILNIAGVPRSAMVFSESASDNEDSINDTQMGSNPGMQESQENAFGSESDLLDSDPISDTEFRPISPLIMQTGLSGRPPEEFDINVDELSADQIKEKLEGMISEHRCKVCLTNKCTVVFLPCLHLATCSDCARVLPDCPICRKPSADVIEIFYT